MDRAVQEGGGLIGEGHDPIEIWKDPKGFWRTGVRSIPASLHLTLMDAFKWVKESAEQNGEQREVILNPRSEHVIRTWVGRE